MFQPDQTWFGKGHVDQWSRKLPRANINFTSVSSFISPGPWALHTYINSKRLLDDVLSCFLLLHWGMSKHVSYYQKMPTDQTWPHPAQTRAQNKHFLRKWETNFQVLLLLDWASAFKARLLWMAEKEEGLSFWGLHTLHKVAVICLPWCKLLLIQTTGWTYWSSRQSVLLSDSSFTHIWGVEGEKEDITVNMLIVGSENSFWETVFPVQISLGCLGELIYSLSSQIRNLWLTCC